MASLKSVARIFRGREMTFGDSGPCARARLVFGVMASFPYPGRSHHRAAAHRAFAPGRARTSNAREIFYHHAPQKYNAPCTRRPLDVMSAEKKAGRVVCGASKLCVVPFACPMTVHI